VIELSVYQIFMIALAIVVQTAGVTAWISRIKNDLNTRVAVLESSHNIMVDDLKEIKGDVKELLRNMLSN